MDADQKKRLIVMQRHALHGLLLRGVMHEFNNAVQAITSYSELLLLAKAPSKQKGFAEEIQAEAMHIAEASRQFLHPHGDNHQLRAEALVESALKLMRFRFRRDRIRLTVDYEADLPTFVGRFDALEQILLNVLMNAREAAMETGEKSIQIAVSVSFVETGLPMLCFTVDDLGPGIDDALRARVFEAFFSTRGEAAGLGLFVSRALAEEHGGSLTLESKDGGGCQARLALPLENART